MKKSEITQALEEGICNFKNEVEKKQALREYDKENRVAQIVQDQLLYCQLPLQNNRVDFAAQSSPKRYVCGDFFEIIPYDDNCFDVILADVMGKGLPAALIGAATKHVLMREVQKLQAVRNRTPSLAEIMHNVEDEMYDKLNLSRTFLTMCVMRINLDNNTVSYISCGHPGALLLKEKAPEVLLLERSQYASWG